MPLIWSSPHVIHVTKGFMMSYFIVAIVVLQEFNKDAILQQFEFSPEEKLLDILPKSFPFYWHEKLEEQELKLLSNQEAESKTNSDTEQTGLTISKVPSALGIVLNSHTVLDGCVIVTNSTVYECRPRLYQCFVK